MVAFMALLLSVSFGGSAKAAECGFLDLRSDDGGVTVVVGELYEYINIWGGLFNATGQAAVCVIHSDGSQSFHTFTGNASDPFSATDDYCGELSAQTDWLTILTGDGDDIITRQVGTQANFRCTNENGNDDEIGFFPGVFKFGLHVRGGDGSDEMYGTNNHDWFYSNQSTLFGYPDDGDWDLMCGYDGNDYFRGDDSDNNDRECFNGGGEGASGDTCVGSGGDVGISCESSSGTAVGISYYYGICEPNILGQGGHDWVAQSGCGSGGPNLDSWFVDCDGSTQIGICGSP